ncbi:hypothetical protein [Pseudonocardia alni]|uniref:hypothetical protein n=1 Tax=Pseudonocardia alni TaxID=33907 RepID=UPI001AD676FB|nr:hypothetical protein [Pseudonocardia alni]MBO4239014.1 hypothetical protein [Pseudonocardia alni]
MATANFARINRRSPDQGTLSDLSFSQEIRILAESHRTEYFDQGSRDQKHWIAADLTLDPSEQYMTGTLGYSEQIAYQTFDQDSWSWVKAESEAARGARENTVVPFAIDIRDNQRWVSFIPRQGLRRAEFIVGLGRVLTTAVADLGLFPQEWDVDLVTSRGQISDWLRANPLVFNLRRTVKFSNPGRDLDSDRQEMRELAANRKTEEFAAPYGKILDISSPAFQEKLDGTEEGNLEVQLQARSTGGGGGELFNSGESVDQAPVANFGTDLLEGMQIALTALQEYAARKRN